MKLGLGVYQNIDLKQKLQQTLSPVIIQSLKVLNKSYSELLSEVTTESEENVVMEVSGQDELISYIKEAGLSMPKSVTGSDSEYSYLDSLKASESSLYEKLMVQLELKYLDESDYIVAEKIISNIDNDGFLRNFSEVKLQIMSELKTKESKIRSLLSLIQSFDPPGVAARNVKESLLIQIDQYSFDDEPELKELLVSIVKDYLQEIADSEIESIALDLGLDTEDVDRAVEFIETNLYPTPVDPGLSSVSNEVAVIPSYEISKKDGNYVFINLEKEKGIKISFNQKYIELLKDPKTDKQTRQFISEKLTKTKQMIDMIKKRNEMIDRVGEIILEKQKNFFDKGIYYLMPISQKEIAEKVDVHTSTISRAVSSKYVLSPLGILPVKYLCPRSISGVSPQRVQYLIEDIVKEQPSLSDIKIAKALEEYEIFIKRRTVAKYRSLMKLPSLYER